MPEYWKIKIGGHLPSGWSPWFANLKVSAPEPGVSLLSGPLPDQAALHGLLERIRDLNLTLISVTRGDESAPDAEGNAKEKEMKILIAGSNGLVGSTVTRHLLERGHEITRLVRGAAGAGQVHWDPDAGQIDAAGLEGFDAVVNMATMRWPMRWTAKAKKAMLANRLATYGLLARTLATCLRKPRVLVCAGGQGAYASSGDTVLTENGRAGEGFLADVDRLGEAATVPASDAGIRVVHLRMPMVLGGSALQQAGFRAGDGRQWISWIGLDEMASIVEFALSTEQLCGPVNAASPNPLRNADFAAVAAAALGRKPGRAMPAWLVRLAMGEMGEEFGLASRRVHPAKLLAAGYPFRFPELGAALRHEKERLEADSAAVAGRESAAIGTRKKELQP